MLPQNLNAWTMSEVGNWITGQLRVNLLPSYQIFVGIIFNIITQYLWLRVVLCSLYRSLVLSGGKEWGERSVWSVLPEKTLRHCEWNHCDAYEGQEDAGQYGQHWHQHTMYFVPVDNFHKLSQEDDWAKHTHTHTHTHTQFLYLSVSVCLFQS